MKERVRREKVIEGWEEERKAFLKERRWKIEEVDSEREGRI